MKTIHVAKAFTLHHASLEGGKKDFAKGSHSVAPEIAEHWFVQGHCDEGSTDAPDGRDGQIAALQGSLHDAQLRLESSVNLGLKLEAELRQLQHDIEAVQKANMLNAADRDAALAKNAELQAMVDAYELQASADKKPAKK